MVIHARKFGKVEKPPVELPEPIAALFNKAAPLGAIIERAQFKDRVLPAHDKMLVEYDGLTFSIRPAWTEYAAGRRSHVYIVGHVLICHLYADTWLWQPSRRLFGVTNEDRMRGLEALVRKAKHLRESAGISKSPYRHSGV